MKSKALKLTWSDEESDGSQEDDNVLVQGHSRSIAINIVCLYVKLDTITTNSKTASNILCDSDSDCGDEPETDDESLQEAYEKMYTQWLKSMCH